jgi:ankyrin repeat protein
VNLEQLRKQAKERVKEGREPRLSLAQHALARELGYPSWPALVHALEADPEAFVLAATSGNRTRADALLAAKPALADDPWVSLVVGRRWDGDPNEPGGPRGWAPLLYVCHSVYASAELGRELLARGADPNPTFRNEYGDMSALYGAVGVAYDAELTRALLEAGADPNDGESLYHGTEARDPEIVRLLLAHGAEPNGTNALAHALDDERLEHVRLLLEGGADPNEHAHVAHAVRRGRDAQTIRLLAEHGADLDRPGGETWRGSVPLRTPYQHAVLRNMTEVAETLAELGADTTVAPEDVAVAARARGEEAPLPRDPDVDQQEVLILALLRGVEAAVPVDFFGVVGGGPPGYPIHHAAWVGDADLVGRLLAQGADPVADSNAEFSKPLAWCALGSQAHRAPGRDYVGVAERLLAAGGELEPRFLEVAQGPLYEWLEVLG